MPPVISSVSPSHNQHRNSRQVIEQARLQLACTPVKALSDEETKKAPGVPGLSKEMSMKKHLGNQDALDAPILSEGTNQARRGSHTPGVNRPSKK